MKNHEWLWEGCLHGKLGRHLQKLSCRARLDEAVSVVSSSDDAPYFNRAKGVIGKVLRSQSTNVDTVSGATYSSNGILGAIDVALKKAVIKNSKNAKKHIKKHSRGGKKRNLYEKIYNDNGPENKIGRAHV